MIAELFTACLVTLVTDGDSMHLKCPARKAEFVVRVAQIDAPEVHHGGFIHWPDQPYGKEALASLKTACLGRKATMTLAGTKDKFGRTDAFVNCEGVDAGTWQIQNGAAWSYNAAKTSKYPSLQARAQTAHVGLWSLPNPIYPQDWRQGKR